jgi:uncharacterized protein YggE
MHRNLLLAFLICGLAFLAIAPVAAAKDKQQRTISLTGTGTVTAPADTAQISTGVISEADTARQALDKNTAAMAKVVAELKGQGIESKDIQTTNFSVRPRFQRSKDGKAPKIIGYRVTNSVTIKVRDLKQLGAILDKVVTQGSNQIGGITFSLNDPTKLEDEARKRAMQDGIRKAKLYADAAGASLGKVVTIQEGFVASPPRPMAARAMLEAKAADVPIEPGEQTLRAQVNVTWELK